MQYLLSSLDLFIKWNVILFFFLPRKPRYKLHVHTCEHKSIKDCNSHDFVKDFSFQ